MYMIMHYIAMTTIFILGIIIFIPFVIVFIQMLIYEYKIRKNGEKMIMKIIDIGILDDNNTLYNGQLTLQDKSGNLAIEKVLCGCLFSPQELYTIGDIRNVKVLNGFATTFE